MAREWSRVIAHVDLDAFYSQVETRLHPHLRGKPLGVAQYNPFGDLSTRRPDESRHMNDSNGSLIAVSYEARAFGVKRNMRGDEARKLCPELQIVQVPTAHGKADLTAYRAAGKEVMDVLAEGGIIAERASIDECYLDVTDAAHRLLQGADGQPPLPPPEQLSQIHVIGADGDDAGAWWQRPAEAWGPNERALAAGAAAVAAARARVDEKLGYTCSAGIAPTKILAKLASGLHKPRQQTVVAFAAIPGLLQDLPIPKLRQLGGKFGEELQQALGITTVGELAAMPRSRLDAAVGEEKAEWLARLARGLDDEVVKPRLLPKSVGCSKTFRGRSALTSLKVVHQWLVSIGKEVEERLSEDRDANNRLPQTLTLGFSSADWQGRENNEYFTRSCPLRKPKAEAIAEDALALVRRWAGGKDGKWAIYSLGLSTSNFVAAPTGSSTLHRFMKPKPAAADAASSPARQAAPSFQLVPSPPQQKLTPEKRAHGTAVQAAGQQRRRTLFPAAAGADREQAAAPGVPHPAGDALHPAEAAADPAPDPIALWDARTAGGAAQQSPTPPQQTAAGAASSTAAGQPDPISGQPGGDCIDLEEDLPSSASPAHSAATLWMPSSMDEVDADALSELPLDLQAEIRRSLQPSSRAVIPQYKQQQTGGMRAFFQHKQDGALRQTKRSGGAAVQSSVRRKQAKR